MKNFAHTRADAPQDDWQLLEDHLEAVASLAGQFAAAFGAEEWGRLLGRLHDIGKASPKFQRYLRGLERGADHKGIGARALVEQGDLAALFLAYCVAGHHGGLPNRFGTGADGGRGLEAIIEKAEALPDGIDIDRAALQALKPSFTGAPFCWSFYTRMLFSCLVDADFLDTEAFMNRERAELRETERGLDGLVELLDLHLAKFSASGRINGLRREILNHCRAMANASPGLFTLSVPTGGGKTLTSLAFALDHAKAHGLRRIIYVIPYTSIIEQNARVFRDIFPEGTVIEHHSNYYDEREGEHYQEAMRHRLACENWDAPIVVTTNVQFFESLFAFRTSRCRKLHNLANSVIILDEAQMLPVDYLDPSLRALEELTTHYGCSVVLCTATQPALRREDFDKGLAGLDESRELAPDPDRLHREFARTRLMDAGTLALDQVADMVRRRDRVLCIVNTRKRASELFAMVEDEPGARHLSALMCPAHRSRELDSIRAALRYGEPCRVVSTQLIEAGVDVSFPEVVREMAGLDSIIQAAGRCNREGELDGLAPVSVFTPAEGVVRAFRQAAGNTETTLRRFMDDPLSPQAVRHFFLETYWLSSDRLDRKGILANFSNPQGAWKFRDAALDFKLIESRMVPVIIPFEDGVRLVAALRHAEHPGGLLRQLQRYTVQVYANQFSALDEHGAIEMVAGVYPVLGDMTWYDLRLGLTFPQDAPDAANFVF